MSQITPKKTLTPVYQPIIRARSSYTRPMVIQAFRDAARKGRGRKG